MNDIALLQLNEFAQLNSRVQLACLPNTKWDQTNYPRAEKNAFIIGWGTVEESGNVSNSLKNAQIEIFDSIRCSKVVPESKKDWSTQICAGTLNSTADTCQGKSLMSYTVKRE